VALSVGIVGLPNVGKSTLFNALSSKQAEAANYAFCTIDPNVGVVEVPDARSDALIALIGPRKVVPATVDFVDIAGLVRGASKGEGRGNAFLMNIRETNAIAHVVRCFEDTNVVHVDNRVDPVADIETIETELVLKDLETVQKRLDRARKMARGNDAFEITAVALCERLALVLDAGRMASEVQPESPDEKKILRDMFLITSKPMFFVANVKDDQLGALDGDPLVSRVRELAQARGVPMVVISAAIEAEIMQLDKEDRGEFLESVGLTEPGLHGVIRTGYEMLDLITFFTAGEKEVHAWDIPKGFTAPQAAGTIHTDFERGFIRAEVIAYEDYIACGSEAAAKAAGKMGVEGKQYVVRDGDIMHFRFNV